MFEFIHTFRIHRNIQENIGIGKIPPKDAIQGSSRCLRNMEMDYRFFLGNVLCMGKPDLIKPLVHVISGARIGQLATSKPQ